MEVLGLDIGGANLKAATHDGKVCCRAFPLWQKPNELAEAIRELAASLSDAPNMIAVTMTGELADCFETKQDGVLFILDQVEAAFPDKLVRIWMTSGEFADLEDARELPTLVAAANWHALASWAARITPTGRAVLLDVGSTTTDLIPLEDGLPANQGVTDVERLSAGELLYTGASRTPVCAILNAVSLEGSHIPLAAELFATSLDVHTITGSLTENPASTDTADGRAATRDNCLARLARMLCCDRTELTDSQIQNIAQQVADAQLDQVARALKSVLSNNADTDNQPSLIISGSGACIADAAVRQVGLEQFADIFALASMYKTDVSAAACAFAVARLAAERCLDDLLPLTAI